MFGIRCPSQEVQFGWSEDRVRLASSSPRAEGKTHNLANYFDKPEFDTSNGSGGLPELAKALRGPMASPPPKAQMGASPGAKLEDRPAQCGASADGASGGPRQEDPSFQTPIKEALKHEGVTPTKQNGSGVLDESLMAPPVP